VAQEASGGKCHSHTGNYTEGTLTTQVRPQILLEFGSKKTAAVFKIKSQNAVTWLPLQKAFKFSTAGQLGRQTTNKG
jgi:hypothetical protein